MSKIVGILSMQRVINYGSFLQAYGLKQLLLAHGAKEVRFIDIRDGKQLKGYETSGARYYLRRLEAMAKVIASGRIRSKRRTLRFMRRVTEKIQSSWKELGLNEYPSFPDVDLAVIGSDEVFHCCQSTKWGFTTQLYGDILNAKEVVSYAASFGGTKLDAIKKLDIGKVIASQLKCLKSISVRDDNSKYIIKELTGIEASINIDPVLAYGFKDELLKADKINESNYILLYSYPDRINDYKEIAAIRDFAKTKGKKLICVMSRYDWCDKAIIPNPFELLFWFKNADMVITETFHGTIFSIITEREFATIGRDSAMPKLTSMLQPYGLVSRLVGQNNSIENIFKTKIDYSAVNKVLESLREETNKYLVQILQ